MNDPTGSQTLWTEPVRLSLETQGERPATNDLARVRLPLRRANQFALYLPHRFSG